MSKVADIGDIEKFWHYYEDFSIVRCSVCRDVIPSAADVFAVMYIAGFFDNQEMFAMRRQTIFPAFICSSGCRQKHVAEFWRLHFPVPGQDPPPRPFFLCE